MDELTSLAGDDSFFSVLRDMGQKFVARVLSPAGATLGIAEGTMARIPAFSGGGQKRGRRVRPLPSIVGEFFDSRGAFHRVPLWGEVKHIV